MILKISVHNNDFQNLLQNFCSNIANAIFPAQTKTGNQLAQNGVEWERLCKLISGKLKIESGKASDTDKKEIIQAVTVAFELFIANNQTKKNQKYLKKEFSCEIVSSVTDEDQNGEIFFVFPTAHRNKVLNF